MKKPPLSSGSSRILPKFESRRVILLQKYPCRVASSLRSPSFLGVYPWFLQLKIVPILHHLHFLKHHSLPIMSRFYPHFVTIFKVTIRFSHPSFFIAFIMSQFFMALTSFLSPNSWSNPNVLLHGFNRHLLNPQVKVLISAREIHRFCRVPRLPRRHHVVRLWPEDRRQLSWSRWP